MYNVHATIYAMCLCVVLYVPYVYEAVFKGTFLCRHKSHPIPFVLVSVRTVVPVEGGGCRQWVASAMYKSQRVLSSPKFRIFLLRINALTLVWIRNAPPKIARGKIMKLVYLFTLTHRVVCGKRLMHTLPAAAAHNRRVATGVVK